jgi:hypothetical protein
VCKDEAGQIFTYNQADKTLCWKGDHDAFKHSIRCCINKSLLVTA